MCFNHAFRSHSCSRSCSRSIVPSVHLFYFFPPATALARSARASRRLNFASSMTPLQMIKLAQFSLNIFGQITTDRKL